MEVVVLGAHQLESARTRCTTLLVDRTLALDASALSSTLSLEEQNNIRAILVTHYHYDHIKDIATFGFNTSSQGTKLVGCTQAVQNALLTYILNGDMWLRLTEFPSPERPAIRFLTAEPGKWLAIEGYRTLPIPMRHAIPVTGFQVVGPDGRSLFYTSDTGPGWVEAALPHLLPDLRLIATEVTLSDDLKDVALRAGHLTPQLLRKELDLLGDRRGSVPPVLVVHINPLFEQTIVDQLAAISRDLGVQITPGQEGLTLNL